MQVLFTDQLNLHFKMISEVNLYEIIMNYISHVLHFKIL